MIDKRDKILRLFGMSVYTEEEQLKMIRSNPLYIRGINNPTTKVQLEAIKANIDAIGDIERFPEEVVEYLFSIGKLNKYMSPKSLDKYSDEFVERLYNQQILKEVL